MERAAVALVVAAMLGLPAPAGAACAALALVVADVPERSVPGPRGPTTVVDLVAGQRVKVSGHGFPTFCDDGGEPSGGGPRRPEPLRDVELLLVQGEPRVPLATDDASASHVVRFDAVLPADLQPGPAVLLAADAGLDLEIAPRR